MRSQVCLKHLNDPKNAYIAFERAAMMSDAIKNPLIYLNFAIYCYEIGQHPQARTFLDNAMQIKMRADVRRKMTIISRRSYNI